MAMVTTHPLFDLRSEYFDLSGKNADGRWSVETLKDKIAMLRKIENERSEAKMQREATARHEAILREIEAARRGTMGEFAANFRNATTDDDLLLARICRKMVSVIENQATTANKLAEEYLSNPFHALEWGDRYFEQAAKFQVAKQFEANFTAGQSLADMRETFTRSLLNKASSVNHSTGQSHNLVNNYLTAAMAELVEMLNGNRY